MSEPRHALIVLAAGGSRRLGTPKQLVMLEGEPLVRRMTRLALLTQPAQALVVVGHRADGVHAVVSDLGVERVDCADWEEGMGASLRAGISALRAEADGVLVVLCDQVALTAEHLESLCAAWRRHPSQAAATSAAGVLGVPALLPRAWFPDLAASRGDRGARDLLRYRADRVVSIEAPELARDVDEASDLPG